MKIWQNSWQICQSDLKFGKILQPQKMAKDLKNLTKMAKFSQIWSHWSEPNFHLSRVIISFNRKSSHILIPTTSFKYFSLRRVPKHNTWNWSCISVTLTLSLSYSYFSFYKKTNFLRFQFILFTFHTWHLRQQRKICNIVFSVFSDGPCGASQHLLKKAHHHHYYIFALYTKYIEYITLCTCVDRAEAAAIVSRLLRCIKS